jgi:hypothetical protein
MALRLLEEARTLAIRPPWPSPSTSLGQFSSRRSCGRRGIPARSRAPCRRDRCQADRGLRAVSPGRQPGTTRPRRRRPRGGRRHGPLPANGEPACSGTRQRTTLARGSGSRAAPTTSRQRRPTTPGRGCCFRRPKSGIRSARRVRQDRHSAHARRPSRRRPAPAPTTCTRAPCPNDERPGELVVMMSVQASADLASHRTGGPRHAGSGWLPC